MSEYFEIAYAVAAKRICLFTGTGFSIDISDNKAPSWKKLLCEICDRHIDKEGFKETLLPSDSRAPLDLDEVAQSIQTELEKNGLSLHSKIAEQIEELELNGVGEKTREFFEKQSFRVVTTNYDKLAESLAGDDVISTCPGRPIPRSDSRVKVMHVHGSIDVPNEMVVTSSDYFRFMEKDTYFSRKLSTLLHENTVVILGYSLGDTNLKTFLNDHLSFVQNHNASNSIFFFSRNKVPQEIRDYYYSCYGMRVIHEASIEEFFIKLAQQLPNAERRRDRAPINFNGVFVEGRGFKDTFLEKENSFFEIVASVAAHGASLEDENVVRILAQIITQKKSLAKKDGAWEQYTHLARWLIYLGSIVNIRGLALEETYLDATKYSMQDIRKKLVLGVSWNAASAWRAGWNKICADNRTLINSHFEGEYLHPDIREVLNSA